MKDMIPTPRTDALAEKLAMSPDGTYLDSLKPSAFWTMANLAKEMETALARLADYAQHGATCLADIGRTCDCGLAELLHETRPIPLDPAPEPQ